MTEDKGSADRGTQGVSCVADVHAVLGEGPVWVERDQALYWVDIKGCRIFRLADGETRSWQTPFRVGALAPAEGGGFVAATERGFAFLDPARDRYELRLDPEPERPGNRFNDGKVDRSGRFWAGTMDDAEREASGALYRLDPGFRATRMDDGYRVTNGPAFSPDGGILYANDSALQQTFAYDVDAGGGLSGRRLFLRFGEGDGYPDGMTVDRDGCLWIAFWDGWCVRRFAPEGALLETVRMPVQRPTSCAFGGPGLDLLFVTSASIGLEEKELAVQPSAGGLFMLKTGSSGIAERPFAG